MKKHEIRLSKFEKKISYIRYVWVGQDAHFYMYLSKHYPINSDAIETINMRLRGIIWYDCTFHFIYVSPSKTFHRCLKNSCD